ncbi:MAG: PilZ domain-containing protein [Mariprofundus sp.]|nr:PilZ domain-containing protein [Mariprofundus sp.]
MGEIENDRKFSRSQINITAQLTPVDLLAFEVGVIDLSLNGILVESERVLPVDSHCIVSIQFGHYKNEAPLSAKGKVIRSHDGKIAVTFDKDGSKRNDAFQSMILFHSKDPQKCLNEFQRD